MVKVRSIDYNEGWRRSSMYNDGFTLQPANTPCSFRTLQNHTILVAGVDEAVLRSLLEEVGVRGDPFGPLYGPTSEPRARVVQLMRQIWTATKTQGPAASLLVDGLFKAALGLVLDACARVFPYRHLLWTTVASRPWWSGSKRTFPNR